MATDKLTELALKARNDQQALSDLINSMADYTRSIIYKRMDGISIADKDDTFQEIMYQLCRSIGKFQAKSAFKTWFSHIAMNNIADHFRHKKRNKEILMSQGVNIDSCDVTPLSEWPIYDDLIAPYSQKNASIVYDKVVNGYTFNEIADRNDLTYEATRSRYRRQMIFLAKEFNENGYRTNT